MLRHEDSNACSSVRHIRHDSVSEERRHLLRLFHLRRPSYCMMHYLDFLDRKKIIMLYSYAKSLKFYEKINVYLREIRGYCGTSSPSWLHASLPKYSFAMACVSADWQARPAGGCSWPQAEKIDNYFPGSTEQPGFDGVHSPGWGKGTLLHSIRVGTAASLASNSS